jgi:hypothetical protein
MEPASSLALRSNISTGGLDRLATGAGRER